MKDSKRLPCRICGEIPVWGQFGQKHYLKCSGTRHNDRHGFTTGLHETRAESVAEWNEHCAARC